MREVKFNLVRSFIHDEIDKDIADHKINGCVCTRVPPEPNGYLHLGHVKSICINFGIARAYNGKCFLYFDDTNPNKEKDEYVQAIIKDIEWMGFKPDKIYFASDHYQDLFDIAVHLIKTGKAYVCDLSPEQVKEYRGTLTESGKESPYRNRTVEENLELFYKMKNGEFKEGACTLRAKIDMSSPILCMRDPVIYRIMYVEHHRTGNKWCIYPMYDFASPLLDALEGVTSSLCGPEFEERRPLYNWSVDNADRFIYKPRQIEFAKINIKNVILGKRYLKRLVDTGVVSGWDDPRMPTISGVRRRGYPAAALREFINTTGVSKALSEADYALLEHCVREDLKVNTECRMAVINPIKLVIDNYDGEETLTVSNGEDKGERRVLFTKELYIEADDFMAEPVPKYFRLFVGNDVRLKGAYIVNCTGYETDKDGRITVHANYYPDSKSGTGSTRKAKGTIHWISTKKALPAEFRLYDQLIDETKEAEDAFDRISEHSLTVKRGYIEENLKSAKVGDSFQMIRIGYFRKDEDSTDALPVFNRTVSLKDSFKK